MNDLLLIELTQYLPVPSGNYNIMVYPSGQVTNPIINTNLYIPENTIFNAQPFLEHSLILVYILFQNQLLSQFSNSWLRFIHLSPNVGLLI